jgi:WD40 repeat protein
MPVARRFFCVIFLSLCGPVIEAIAQADRSVPILEHAPLPPGAARRLGTNRLRFPGPIEFLRFSPDDKTLVVGSKFRLYFCDTKTWRETWHISGDRFTCLSHDGKFMARRVFESKVEIWDIAKKSIVQARDLGALEIGVTQIEFGASGDELWIAGDAGNVYLYDWRANKIVRRLALPKNNIAGFGFLQSGDRKTIAFVHDDRILIDDGVKGTRLSEINRDEFPASYYAFSPDGKAIAGFSSGAIYAQDLATGQYQTLSPDGLIKELEMQERGASYPRLGFSPDGANLLVVWRELVAVDIARKKTIARTPLNRAVESMAVSNDNKIVALGYEDGAVEVRDLATLKPLVSDPHPRGAAVSVAFAKDGRTLAAAYSMGTPLRLWSVLTGALLKEFSLEDQGLQLPYDELRCLSFLAGAGKLAVGERWSWDVETGREESKTRVVDIDSEYIRFLSASADGARSLRVRANAKKTTSLTLYDLATRREICDLPWGDPSTSALAEVLKTTMSADGRRIGLHLMHRSPASESIALWEVKEKQPVLIYSQPLEERRQANIALSPDGRLFTMNAPAQGALAGSPRQVRLLPRGTLLWKLEGPDVPIPPDAGTLDSRFERRSAEAPEFLAFSADNQFLAEATFREILVREAISGAIVLRLAGHRDVRALAFSPDARLLASASADSTVLLWKVPAFAAAKPGVWRPERFEALWPALREGAQTAYQAMADLHAGGDACVRLIDASLPPPTAKDIETLQQSIEDLDSRDFQTREKATERLKAMGRNIETHLAERIARPADLELKRRLTALSEWSQNVGIRPNELQAQRAIYVLEQIGTPQARGVLDRLAKGHPHEWTTQSARAALKRLPQ